MQSRDNISEEASAPTVISVLADLKQAPDLGATMATYLAAPSTPAPVRRFLTAVRDQANRLATRTVVTL